MGLLIATESDRPAIARATRRCGKNPQWKITRDPTHTCTCDPVRQVHAHYCTPNTNEYFKTKKIATARDKRVCMYASVWRWNASPAYACIRVFAQVCVYCFASIAVFTYAQIHTHTHAITCEHTCARTHTHTHHSQTLQPYCCVRATSRFCGPSFEYVTVHAESRLSTKACANDDGSLNQWPPQHQRRARASARKSALYAWVCVCMHDIREAIDTCGVWRAARIFCCWMAGVFMCVR